MKPEELQKLKTEIGEIERMLKGLIRSLERPLESSNP
jgi:hypothetical protein